MYRIIGPLSYAQLANRSRRVIKAVKEALFWSLFVSDLRRSV